MAGVTLPPPAEEQLETCPLELVVCQIRHERNMASVDPRRVLAVHEKVAELYPVIEQGEERELSVSAGVGVVPAVASSSTPSWTFRSDDRAWTVAITADYFALETSQYLNWDDLKSRLETLLLAVHEVLQPSVEQRIGLRYVNALSLGLARAADWKGWIEDAFLGPALHPALGAALVASQQVLHLQLGPAERALLRHGIEDREGDWVYLIDEDCYQQQGRAFIPADALGAVDRLHSYCLQLFQAVITSEMLDRLRRGVDNG